MGRHKQDRGHHPVITPCWWCEKPDRPTHGHSEHRCWGDGRIVRTVQRALRAQHATKLELIHAAQRGEIDAQVAVYLRWKCKIFASRRRDEPWQLVGKPWR